MIIDGTNDDLDGDEDFEMNTALLDACLLVSEDGQRPDAGEAIGYGSHESRCERAAAALIAWAPAALREHGVGNLSPAVLAAVRQVIAAAMVKQCDVNDTLVLDALKAKARQQWVS